VVDKPETFWAYLAGMIDADGTVTICQNGPRMILTQNNREFLEGIQADLNGFGYIQTNAKGASHLSTKACYSLSWGSDPMRIILPKIIPYMRVKQQKAVLILAYLQVTHRSVSRLPEMLIRREALLTQWKELNTNSNSVPRGNDKGR
jgi:hypothetical protein